MSNQFLGQITMFGGNFAPKGTALCNGQSMTINQNQALFALLGTTYGGNGQTTFALPNLQSQLPNHFGQGPGLSPYVQGQTGGTTAVTIGQTTMPTHTHTLNATTAAATSATMVNGDSVNMLPATPTVQGGLFYANPNANPGITPRILAASTMSTVGGSQAHTNLMPSLCITFIIALQGIFPSRN
jgi:microcystin-dependent protein